MNLRVDSVRLENRAHRDAIREFAIYERACHALTESAKVTRYVGLLAEKHTRAALVRLKSSSPKA